MPLLLQWEKTGDPRAERANRYPTVEQSLRHLQAARKRLEAGDKVPEHCLIRVVDVTVQPGRTYEYRLRVRMANPDQGRAELLSEWSAVPIQLRVDAELRYYAVDEADFESRYDGPYAATVFRKNRVVLMQAHRWLDWVTDKKRELPIGIGEWVIARRFPAYRGEYLGPTERVRVPYWAFRTEKFILADDGDPKKGPGIDVRFGAANEEEDPETILVDFTPPRFIYDRVRPKTAGAETRRVIQDAAVEVLLLTPEGKLVARNGAEDVRDPQRRERVREWFDRLRELKAR